MNNLGKRLKQLRKKKGLTQEELGKPFNLGKSTISQYESGTSRPDYNTLQKLADVFTVSTDYLLGHTVIGETPAFSLPPSATPVGKMVKVPILGEIRAGTPVFAEQHILGYDEVPANELNGGEHFYLVVKGNSMTGSNIYPGYKVLVRQQEYVENNQIAVVLINNEEATLKRIKYLNDTVLLYPDNPAYDAQVYKPDEVQILGVVVEVKFKP